MEFGSQLRVQEALLVEVERFGLRAYLGAGYDSGRWWATRKAGFSAWWTRRPGARSSTARSRSSGAWTAA